MEGHTYLDAVRARAAAMPDGFAVALVEDGETVVDSLTYATLDRRARAIAVELATSLKPGDRAVLLYPSGLGFIEAFLGCLYAGVIAVPMSPPVAARLRTAAPRLVESMRKADARAILGVSTNSYLRELESLLHESGRHRWIDTDKISDRGAVKWRRPPEVNPDTVAFLQFTSGSTGAPKGVIVTHRNLMANTEMIRDTYQLSEKDTFCHWLPLFHDMGLIGCTLSPIRFGIPVYFMPPSDFLMRPYRWLRAMTKFRGTIAPAPNFAYELCARRVTAEERELLDLRTWTKALNGAEPVVSETMSRFSRAFSSAGFSPSSHSPCYGLAEATLLVAGALDNREPREMSVTRASLALGHIETSSISSTDVIRLPSSGRLASAGRILIVDPETRRPCSDGQVGEIWIAGDHVAAGYWRDEAATEATFEARLDGGTEPYLRSGDLGFMWDDHLYVSGRRKDVIIQRGTNHYPHDIEWTAENTAGVGPGSVAAFGLPVDENGLEQVVLFVEVPRDADPVKLQMLRNGVYEAVVDVHGVTVQEVCLVPRGTIPRTSSGKTRRSTARQMYLNGAVERLGTAAVQKQEVA